MKRIPLFAKTGSDIVGWAQVDDEDYPALSKYKWQKSYDNRAIRPRGEKYIQMGRVVMGVEKRKGIRIEHVDGDTLNNQKSNLKVRKDTRE